MMMERYPNLKEEVGDSIPDFESSSLLWRWHVGLLSLFLFLNHEKKRRRRESGHTTICRSEEPMAGRVMQAGGLKRGPMRLESGCKKASNGWTKRKVPRPHKITNPLDLP